MIVTTVWLGLLGFIDDYIKEQELLKMQEEKSDYDFKLEEAISTEEIMDAAEVYQDESQNCFPQ